MKRIEPCEHPCCASWMIGAETARLKRQPQFTVRLPHLCRAFSDAGAADALVDKCFDHLPTHVLGMQSQHANLVLHRLVIR